MIVDVLDEYNTTIQFTNYVKGRLGWDVEYLVPPVDTFHGQEKSCDFLLTLLEDNKLSSLQMVGFWNAIVEMVALCRHEQDEQLIDELYSLLSRIPNDKFPSHFLHRVGLSSSQEITFSNEPIFYLSLAIKFDVLDDQKSSQLFDELNPRKGHITVASVEKLLKLYQVHSGEGHHLLKVFFLILFAVHEQINIRDVFIQHYTTCWLKNSESAEQEELLLQNTERALKTALIIERAPSENCVCMLSDALQNIKELPWVMDGSKKFIQEKLIDLLNGSVPRAPMENPKNVLLRTTK